MYGAPAPIGRSLSEVKEEDLDPVIRNPRNDASEEEPDIIKAQIQTAQERRLSSMTNLSDDLISQEV